MLKCPKCPQKPEINVFPRVSDLIFVFNISLTRQDISLHAFQPIFDSHNAFVAFKESMKYLDYFVSNIVFFSVE